MEALTRDRKFALWATSAHSLPQLHYPLPVTQKMENIKTSSDSLIV